MWVDFDVRDNRRWTFRLEEASLWIMDSYFGQKWRFEGKNVLIIGLFLINTQLFASQDINWWTGVVWVACGLLWCFYQLFDSDGTHSLQSIHWWARDAMLHFSKSALLVLGWPDGKDIFKIVIFGWTFHLTNVMH